MSLQKQIDGKRPGTFASDSRGDTTRLIDDTERLLVNTRIFLERLPEGEEATSKYVEGLKSTLENDLRRLKRDSREAEENT